MNRSCKHLHFWHLIRCGRCACQAKADALLEKGIGSMTDGQAVAQALLHETADAQRAASWALEYEEIAQVGLLICPSRHLHARRVHRCL